uniref:Major facilitator superfamily (MFS) profile domain-containing protein n=1 Tax=Strigamia maritima TaxID=126957 RepID=T1IHA6_STRMM
MEEKPLESNCETVGDDEEQSFCEKREFEPPDGGWGWVIVVATFLTSLVVDGIIFSFGILLPEILIEFNEGQSLTSWVGSALAGTYLLIGPIAGALANKYGCRTVSIIGSFISAGAFAASVFANNIIYLIVSYGIIGGIGFGFIYLPSMVIIQTYFEKKRAFATGIAVCGSGIGMFIISPLTQYLIEYYGWRGMLLIQAGISLHCVPFSVLLRPVEDSVHPKKKKLKPLLIRTKEARDALFRSSFTSTDADGEDDEKKMPMIQEETTDSNKNHKAGIVEMLNLNLLKSPTFVTICIAGFLTFMGFFVPFIYISDYAISTGRTKVEASYLISVIGITNTVGRLICGWVTDRPNVKALHINNSALLVSGIATALVPFCVTYEVQIVYCVIFGSAIACYVSLRSILLVEYLGLDTLTNSFGLTLLFQGTASMIGPPVAGWFYKQGNSYDVPFFVAGSIMAVSGLICVPLPWISRLEEKRKKKKQLRKLNQTQTQIFGFIFPLDISHKYPDVCRKAKLPGKKGMFFKSKKLCNTSIISVNPQKPILWT